MKVDVQVVTRQLKEKRRSKHANAQTKEESLWLSAARSIPSKLSKIEIKISNKNGVKQATGRKTRRDKILNLLL